MPHRVLDDESRYRLLKLLEQNPELSQRDVAGALGISLGKANYCVRALIERGWIKVGNFSRSGNKTAYFYKLTPKGVSEKARAARRFLNNKLEEHERVTAEIEALRSELHPAESADPPSSEAPKSPGRPD
ncbi:MAG: MarR family EPS-associated transcriptional regulator [Halofilum sp. (in: g-proteobacteria)]